MPIQRFRFALSFGWHGFKCRADVDHITPTLNSPLVATLPHSPDRTPRPRLAARTTPFSRRSEPRGSRLAQLGLPSGSATRDSTFGRGCPAPPVPECVSPQPCRRRYKVLVRPPNMTQTFPPGCNSICLSCGAWCRAHVRDERADARGETLLVWGERRNDAVAPPCHVRRPRSGRAARPLHAQARRGAHATHALTRDAAPSCGRETVALQKHIRHDPHTVFV